MTSQMQLSELDLAWLSNSIIRPISNFYTIGRMKLPIWAIWEVRIGKKRSYIRQRIRKG